MDWNKVIFSAFLTLNFAIAKESDYVVKEGDTLSQIAQSIVGSPISGRQGSIQEILKRNTVVVNPDHIYPGLVLKLPKNSSNLATSSQNMSLSRKPAAEESKESPSFTGFKQGSFFRLAPRISFSGVDMKDVRNSSRGVFLSKLNSGLVFDYKQLWSKTWDSRLNVDWNKVSMNLSDSRPVENSKITLAGFSFGVTRRFGDTFAFGVDIASHQEVFPRALNVTSFYMDTVNVLRMRLLPQVDLYDSDTFNLKTVFMVGYLFPGDTGYYKIKTGYEAQAGIDLLQKLSPRWGISTNAFLNYQSQNTSLVKRRSAEMGVSMGANFKTGKN